MLDLYSTVRDAYLQRREQYHLRQIFVFLDMLPLNKPEVMIGNAATRFDADGNLTDDTTPKYIGELLRSLVDWDAVARAVTVREGLSMVPTRSPNVSPHVPLPGPRSGQARDQRPPMRTNGAQ